MISQKECKNVEARDSASILTWRSSSWVAPKLWRGCFAHSVSQWSSSAQGHSWLNIQFKVKVKVKKKKINYGQKSESCIWKYVLLATPFPPFDQEQDKRKLRNFLLFYLFCSFLFRLGLETVLEPPRMHLKNLNNDDFIKICGFLFVFSFLFAFDFSSVFAIVCDGVRCKPAVLHRWRAFLQSAIVQLQLTLQDCALQPNNNPTEIRSKDLANLPQVQQNNMLRRF